MVESRWRIGARGPPWCEAVCVTCVVCNNTICVCVVAEMAGSHRLRMNPATARVIRRLPMVDRVPAAVPRVAAPAVVVVATKKSGSIRQG